MLTWAKSLAVTGVVVALWLLPLAVTSGSAYLYLVSVVHGASAILAFWNVKRLKRHFRRYKHRKRQGYIYVFADIGQVVPAVKIGRGSDDRSRLRSHQTAAPFGLLTIANFRVNDAVYVEKVLHYRYRQTRVSKRNEWFLVLTPVMMYELFFMRMLG